MTICCTTQLPLELSLLKRDKINAEYLFIFSYSTATGFAIYNTKYKKELQIDSVKRTLFFKTVNSFGLAIVAQWLSGIL